MTDRLYPHVSKAATKTRLDIAQWPGLDKLTYEFLVVGSGEAIAGPFMFGRAFDAPPFFTYSAVAQGSHQGTPELTIGVSEWILDEQELWIGANLWVRFKICHEPHLKGTSTFGAGFEEILARTGGGPEGDELPRRVVRGGTFGTIYVWNSTLDIDTSGDFEAGLGTRVGIENFMDPYHYVWQGATGADIGGEVFQTAIRISTANPDSGLYHLRITTLEDTTGSFIIQAVNNLFAGALFPCVEGTKESSTHRLPLWRIDPGDKVTLDWRAMISTVTGMEANGGPYTRPTIQILNKGTNALLTFSPALAPGNGYELDTFYQDYHAELVAPADAYYVIVLIASWRNAHATMPEAYWDIDNLDLVISGTNQSAIGSGIEVRLNFEGQTLKGYNNIHEIPPRSAPTKVVLS